MLRDAVYEQSFTEELVRQLAAYVAPLHIETKVNVLYSLSLDDKGNLQGPLDEERQAVRGRRGLWRRVDSW